MAQSGTHLDALLPVPDGLCQGPMLPAQGSLLSLRPLAAQLAPAQVQHPLRVLGTQVSPADRPSHSPACTCDMAGTGCSPQGSWGHRQVMQTQGSHMPGLSRMLTSCTCAPTPGTSSASCVAKTPGLLTASTQGCELAGADVEDSVFLCICSAESAHLLQAAGCSAAWCLDGRLTRQQSHQRGSL